MKNHATIEAGQRHYMVTIWHDNIVQARTSVFVEADENGHVSPRTCDKAYAKAKKFAAAYGCK